jgi:hypothetical protein
MKERKRNDFVKTVYLFLVLGARTLLRSEVVFVHVYIDMLSLVPALEITPYVH